MRMTNLTSHTFYKDKNGERREPGTSLRRVVISDNKISIYDKQVKLTNKSRVPWEYLIQMHSIILLTNKAGQKYIKVLRKAPSGAIYDESFGTAFRKPLNGPTPSIEEYIPRDDIQRNGEAVQLIVKTLKEWFNEPTDPQDFPGMIFPCLRETSTRERIVGERRLLEWLQQVTSTVVPALRESSDWSSFLRFICGTSIHTQKDEEILSSDLNLIFLASMKTNIPLSEFNFNTDVAAKLVADLSLHDWTILHLAMKHLTHSQSKKFLARLAAVFSGRTVLQAARNTQHLNKLDRSKRVVVSPALRAKFARDVAEYFEHIESSPDIVGFYSQWFAENEFFRSIRGESMVGALEKRFMEAFNIPFNPLTRGEAGSRGVVKHVTKDGYEFYELDEPRPMMRFDNQLSQLFMNLMVNNKAWKSHIPYPSVTYPNPQGNTATVHFGYYTSTDLFRILEVGLENVDKALIALGRELTPENRIMYLCGDHKERKFKNTWFYYDLGVFNNSMILLFKRYNYRTKATVELLKDLPLVTIKAIGESHLKSLSEIRELVETIELLPEDMVQELLLPSLQH